MIDESDFVYRPTRRARSNSLPSKPLASAVLIEEERGRSKARTVVSKSQVLVENPTNTSNQSLGFASRPASPNGRSTPPNGRSTPPNGRSPSPKGRSPSPINKSNRSVSPKRLESRSPSPNRRSPSPARTPRAKSSLQQEENVRQEIKRSQSCPPRRKRKIGHIYLLYLRGGNYYVGYTTNPRRRFSQHQAGEKNGGATWSSLHKPLCMKILKSDADSFEEDMFVKKIMSEKGIDKVRGGSYSTVRLHDYVKDQLKKEIYNATGRCFHCGKKGHFLNQCRTRKKGILIS